MCTPNMRIFSPYLYRWLLTVFLSALSFGNAAWASGSVLTANPPRNGRSIKYA